MVEQRRSHRSQLNVAVTVQRKAAEELIAGRARDISLGGMFVEAATVLPFGAEVAVRVLLPGQKEEMTLAGVVRWTNAEGMGVQFGLLGARETYAVTEIVRKS